MDGNDLVAEFIHSISWSTLPLEVKRKAKMAFVDVLGAALSGTIARVSEITARYAAQAWQGDEATVLLRDQRSTAGGAAFANGYAANAFDTDDCAKFTRGHPGAQVFAVALAMCERLHLDGAALLTGMVAGYEVAHRTGRIWHHHHNVYQACGSWGSVATAAVAAHLMQLDHQQIKQALGIAEYHAPNLPMMRDIDNPAMVKHGIGWGAMTGIAAADLAACGFTSVPSILGSHEYWDWVSDIGNRYTMVEGVTFKEYGSCAWSHPPIDVIRQLIRRYRVRTEEIAHIRVEGFAETVRLGSRLPHSTEEAQFNTAWPLAAYLVYGEVGPRQTSEPHLQDPHITDLARKIELVESPELTRLSHLKWIGNPEGYQGSEVEITLVDGHKLTGSTDPTAISSAVNWSEAQVEAKFRWLAAMVLPDERVDAIVQAAWQLDSLAQLSDFIELIRG